MIRKSLEKIPFHGLFLSGHDVEDGIRFWELQDSRGEAWGDKGFIKLARFNRLIKQAFEFTVNLFHIIKISI